MPDAEMELPYEGAKEMILVDDVDDQEFLCKLVESMWKELPDKKKRNKNRKMPSTHTKKCMESEQNLERIGKEIEETEQSRRKIRFFIMLWFSSQTDILLRIYNQKRIIAVTFFLIWKIIEIMPIFGSSLQIKRDKINCGTRLEEKCGMIKEGLIGKRESKELCWNLDMSYYWLAYKSAVPITTLMHIIDGSYEKSGRLYAHEDL